MDNTTYYQRDREIMLNWAKNYYENDKERLRKLTRNKHRNLSEEDKEKIEKIDVIICLKKRSRNWKNTKNKDIKSKRV